MTRQFIYTSLLTGLLIICSEHASATARISSFQTNGNGCPPGTYSYLLSSDQQTLQILFASFIAELPGQATKSCHLLIELELEPNESLSWYQTEHRGFVQTAESSDAEFWARYSMLGPGGFDSMANRTWPAATADYFTVMHESPGTSWSRCGGKQKIAVETKIRLKGRSSSPSMLSLDDQTQSVGTALRFRYRSCQGS